MTPTPVTSAGEVTVGNSVTVCGSCKRWVERLGEPEVENLHRAVGPYLDVRGLQITMNDALVVGGLQCFSDLARDGERLFDRDRPGAIRSASVGPSTNSNTSARTPSDASRP